MVTSLSCPTPVGFGHEDRVADCGDPKGGRGRGAAGGGEPEFASELRCKRYRVQFAATYAKNQTAAKTGITSICKLLLVAQKSWRAPNVPRLMREVYDGKLFKDGIAVRTTIEPTRKAA